jgi:hypothetical protein
VAVASWLGWLSNGQNLPIAILDNFWDFAIFSRVPHLLFGTSFLSQAIPQGKGKCRLLGREVVFAVPNFGDWITICSMYFSIQNLLGNQYGKSQTSEGGFSIPHKLLRGGCIILLAKMASFKFVKF